MPGGPAQDDSLSSACEELADICDALLRAFKTLPGERVAATVGTVMLVELANLAPVARDYARASRGGLKVAQHDFELEVLVPHASMRIFAKDLERLDRKLAVFKDRIEALRPRFRLHWKRLAGESPAPITGWDPGEGRKP